MVSPSTTDADSPRIHRSDVLLYVHRGCGSDPDENRGGNLPPAGATAILANPLIVLQDFALLAELSLYGLFILLLIFALMSLTLFHETMNPLKACGITVIVLGVVITFDIAAKWTRQSCDTASATS